MIRTIIKLLVKVLESKLVKSGIEEQILKHKNYIDVAKSIWNIVDENYRITEKAEEKLESKAAQFDSIILTKFPELNAKDAAELRQSIAGEVNAGKDAVIDNSELLKQLQKENTELKNQVTLLSGQLDQLTKLVKQTEQTEAEQIK